MDQKFLDKIQNQLKKQRRRRLWKRVVSVLGIAVVFCTLSALILPAITLSDTAYCGIEEHVHEDACYNKTLICNLSEEETAEVHEHTESCYALKKDLVCPLEEGLKHVHDESCISIENRLTCGQEEKEGHVHSEQCMMTETVFVCGLEGDPTHVHEAGCSQEQTTIICGLEESEGHVHTESCYTEITTEVCGLTEEAHVHTNTCWKEYPVLICEIDTDNAEETCEHTEEEAETCEHRDKVDQTHKHTDACYQKELICKVEEHKHEIRCFSNPKADLESAADWERTLPHHLSGDIRKDVITIAQSQLGYTESDENYIVTEDEQIRGYTRYGQWYGSPYGDWCAMFASFCLSYANADVPLGAACSSWIRQLKSNGIYWEPDEYIPTSGDIIFFDWGVNNTPDHVGLVVEVIPAKDGQPARVKTIEGNCSDCVMYMTYNLNNPVIFGYGEIVPTERKKDEGNIQEGDFWKRIESFNEIQENDKLLIVSAERNMALTYDKKSSKVGTSVILEQVNGHEDYYEIFDRDNHSMMEEEHLNSIFSVSDISNNGIQLKCAGETNAYLVLNDTIFGSDAATLNVQKQSSENIWKLSDGKHYLTFTQDIPFISSKTATQSDAQRDMLIFRWTKTSLDIPADAASVSNVLTIPEEPEYNTMIPSDEIEGVTAINGLDGFTVRYASDPATSDILEKIEGLDAENGKILTDKSVIYGKDDFGAITSYEEGTFGVTLSAVGQTSAVKGHAEPALDVVIILDTSNSMINKSQEFIDTDGDIRMTWAVNEVNCVIDAIMAQPENRVGLVTFSDASQVVLPLDHYTTENGQYVDLEHDASQKDDTAFADRDQTENNYDLNINENVKNKAGKTLSFDFLYGSGNPNWEGTFTQSGIQEAADLLLNNGDTVDDNGTPKQPVILLISDGGPTLCSSNYKSPLDGPIYGKFGHIEENVNDSDIGDDLDRTDSNRYGIHGYYTILTAQYYKNRVGSHYGVQTKFVTVGVGIDRHQTASTDPRLHDNGYCRAVLNPTASNLKDALSSFDGRADEGPQMIALLNETLDSDHVSIWDHSEDHTTLGMAHSAVPVLPNPYTSYSYADAYYIGKKTNLASDLIAYLNGIQFQEYTWKNVLKNKTDLEFEDPIGKGMEVKGEPILRFGVNNYEPTSAESVGNRTTYVYDYEVTYAQAYPDNVHSDNMDVKEVFDLSGISVQVTTEGKGTDALQTIRMFIPQELVPVVYPEKYGKFLYKEEPLRFIYKVGLTDASMEDCKAIGSDETRTYSVNRSDEITTAASYTPNKGKKVVQQLENNGKLILKKDAKAITATMKWPDTEKHDSIQMYLLADGAVVDTRELSSKNNWTYTWTSLPKVDYRTNKMIHYSVSENYAAGYTPSTEFLAKGKAVSTDTFLVTNIKSKEPLTLTIQTTNHSGVTLEGSVFDLYIINPNDAGAVQIPGTEETGMLIRHEIQVGEDGLTMEIPGEDHAYYLVEIAAPESFELVKAPIKFAVEDENILISEDNGMASVSGNTISVVNDAIYELPAAEGMKTTLFYVIGTVLALGSVVLIVTKKRMDQ